MKMRSKLSWGEWALLTPCLVIMGGIILDAIWYMPSADQLGVANYVISSWFTFTVWDNRHTLRGNKDGQYCRIHSAWPRDRTCILRGDHVMPDTPVPS